MFPGFFSFITPLSLSSTILFHLVDEMLGLQPDYAGLIFLVYHVSSCDLPVKLEIAKRLLQTTFVKQHSTVAMARQTGWQESIARLLIRKPITSSPPDDEKRRSFGINLDVLNISVGTNKAISKGSELATTARRRSRRRGSRKLERKRASGKRMQDAWDSGSVEYLA